MRHGDAGAGLSHQGRFGRGVVNTESRGSCTLDTAVSQPGRSLRHATPCTTNCSLGAAGA